MVCIPAKAACMHMAKFRLLDHNTPPNDRRKIEDVRYVQYFHDLKKFPDMIY